MPSSTLGGGETTNPIDASDMLDKPIGRFKPHKIRHNGVLIEREWRPYGTLESSVDCTRPVPTPSTREVVCVRTGAEGCPG